MADPDTLPQAPGVFWRVSVMMGFEWGTLGLWMATLSTYLNANTGAAGTGAFGASFIGDIGIASALGAIASPVVCGMLTDRLLNLERLLALLHIASGMLLFAALQAESQARFFLLVVAYFQCYAPTAALISSLALRRLPDTDRQFPQSRACGTLGWIVAGALVGLWPWVAGESIEATRVPMMLAAAAHGIGGLYALTLPPTPPAPLGPQRSLAAGRLWRNRRVILFLAVSVIAAAPMKFYEGFINLYLNQNNYPYPAFLQTLGQTSELAVMLALPLLLRRFSRKLLFAMGVVAWMVRFTLLAFAQGDLHPWMVCTAIGLHGFSFVLVFILGQLYIDRLAPPDLRGSAQGLHLMAVFGVASLIGAKLSGTLQALWLTPEGTTPAPYNWQAFWLAPAAISLFALVLFVLLFSESRDPSDTAGGVATTTASDPASGS